MLSRRHFIRPVMAGLVALSVLMAGCQSKTAESVDPKGAEAKPVEQSIPELKIAVPGDVGPLNLYLSSGNESLLELVYDKLFAPSPFVKEPQPWLAESATQVDDLNWVVKLRSGIKWHDGQPFTAEDVKFTFEYYRDGPSNRYTHHVSEVPRVEKIEAEDASTVRFTCAYACPSLASITMADLPILPKHIWEKVENPRKFTELPVGTGPYKLTEYKPDQYYKLEANPDYFKGRPLVDSLVMPIIKDPTAMFNALRAGEVDAASRGVPPELLESFKKLPNMKVAGTKELSLTEVRINFEKEPFNEPKFREALSLAVDRKAITDTVLLGEGRPGLQGYPHPDSPWTSPTLSTPFDADKAKAVLDQLNYVDRNGDGVRETPAGQALDFSIKVSSTEPGWIRSAELLKQQFANVGIKTTVEVLDSATIGTLGQSRKFDMYVGSIGPHGVADPDQFVMSHRSGYLWSKGLAYPEMDELTKKWMAEANIDKRKEISFEMQALFNRQPTSLVLYYPTENYAYRADKFDRWVESPGFGIIHKYSLLPEEARKAAGVTN
ncbi:MULTISPECIES: ABC transporter substrate-binding protein [Paenibacillus]|uniref:ABC transporter substrate-binding protein n=1 Tax=Paenibacillus naphthalenovorans TaxID=162209 RepID=A0A0U2WF26_9BACL|nr:MULTISPECIES: peptide ABC transporter substrate-binding protein [Paenibacillus]ALS24974.1 ABC transporter substrate-binding protein [Paenibacillus naphthalenovorans]GCL74096.1 ABC transporter substrate-binding protein [Paenibacillus naphthalenovorans]SDJ34439.1 peptide/nickel transport system substrate-binding protein [Paenibacillus naphthalenovorans]